MKKILALVLALVMLLSMTSVSFGEAAEAYTYSSFSEHLMEFVNGINLQQKDLYLAAAVQDQTYQLLAGMNDEGVINLMAGQDQQEIGTLQIDSEAAYLNYQGSIMGLKFETVKNFIDHLPQKAMQYLAKFGIDPEKLMADIQTLIGLFQKLVARIQPAIEQNVDGDIITVKLNGEKYSELYAEAIDELLNDASFQEILSRYLPMLGVTYDAEQIASAWQSARGELVELIKKWQMTITVNQTTGDFTLDSDFAMPEDTNIAIAGNGNGSENGLKANITATIKQGETEIKEEITVDAEKTSTWLDYPNKFNETVVISQDGQEIGTVNAAYELDSFGTPVSLLFTMNQQGQEIARIQYEDGTFVMYSQGEEVLFIQYNGELTIRVPNQELHLRKVEDDADHATFELTITQYGQTVTAHIIFSIADDGNGSEYFQIAVTNGEQTPVLVQVQQTEKQAFSLLKDQETLNWISEEQLNGLFDNLVNYVISQVQSKLSSGYSSAY